MRKTGLLLKLFGLSVKDKSPEEIEQIAMDTADAFDSSTQKQEDTAAKNEEEGAEKPAVKDAAFFDALNNKVDKLLSLLDHASGEKNTEESAKDPMDAAIEKLEGKEEEKEETKDSKKEASVIPAEDTQAGSFMDKAMAAAILKQVRPSVAAIKDEKERMAVSNAIIACVTQDWASDSEIMIQAAQKNARKLADRSPKMDLEAVQKAYDNLNPHRKETK